MKHRLMVMFGAGFLAALASGWMAFPRVLYRRAEQPIQFSHKLHTGDKVGMTCDSCHVIEAGGRFSGIPTIDTCAPCHTGVQGKSADERRLVNEYVAKAREIPWRVYARQPENVYFSHAAHVKLAGVKCERCHGPHGTSERLRPFEQNRISTYSRDVAGRSDSPFQRVAWNAMKMDDCSSCHEARGVHDSCLTCHK